MTHYDYIVIGAGSAGCVVANRLKDPETTVLLLEAGNWDTKPEIQIPADCLKLLGSEVDWGYFSQPESYLNDRKIFCSRGKVLGGSSSINAMLYVRGNPHDYDRWQELGNSGWSYQDVLPYFKKSEHQHRGADTYHGVDGELSVTDPIAPAALSQRFVDACMALGYDYNPDFNAMQQQGELIAATRVTEGELLCKSLPAIRIDQVRKVSEFLSTSALDASFKVVVIQHADAIYPAAANALLKTLEEPISGILILISSNLAQLLPTVTSRCQKIPFFPLLNTEILQVLSQIGHTEIIAHPEIIALTNGRPGRAIHHYQKLRSLPPELLFNLQLPPKDLVTALSIGKEAELLNFQQQLWLLEYLEYCWWHKLKDPTWLTKLDNAKNQLKQLAQPRLVWDALLMP